MAEPIYVLCAVTSLTAALLLMRHYRTRRAPLLLWSCIGFFGLAVNNALLVIDLVLLTGSDLSLPRTFAGTLAVVMLVYGLVWETGR